MKNVKPRSIFIISFATIVIIIGAIFAAGKLIIFNKPTLNLVYETDGNKSITTLKSITTDISPKKTVANIKPLPSPIETLTSNTADGKKAVDYINAQGYIIVKENIPNGSSYILDKSMMTLDKYRSITQIWMVQSVLPEDYFGKEIFEYGFLVRNHPIDISYAKENIDTATRITVMMCEGEIIGGYSMPDSVPNDIGVVPVPLDGSRVDYKGLSYQEWIKNWYEKYSN